MYYYLSLSSNRISKLNDILFFDDKRQEFNPLYTDKLLVDIGSFYYKQQWTFLSDVIVEQITAFISSTHNCQRSDLPYKRRESIICALSQGLNIHLRLPISINIIKSSKFNKFVMLKIKTSKTVVNHTEIFIVIESTTKQKLSWKAFCKLFLIDLLSADALVFNWRKQKFNFKDLINKLKFRLDKDKIDIRNYPSHRFCYIILINALNSKLLNKCIKKLK